MALSDLDRNRAKPLERRHRRPPGARLSHIRRQYSVFSESRSLSDKSIVSVPGYGRGHQQDSRPAVPLGCRRLVPGAGGTVADPGAAGDDSGPRGRARLRRRSSTPFAAGARRPRVVRRRPRRRESCCWPPTGRRRCRDRPQERMVELLAGAAESTTPKRAQQVEQEIGAHSRRAAHRFARHSLPARRPPRSDRQGREAEHRAGQQAGRPTSREIQLPRSFALRQ